jgi:hypothetical protein
METDKPARKKVSIAGGQIEYGMLGNGPTVVNHQNARIASIL